MAKIEAFPRPNKTGLVTLRYRKHVFFCVIVEKESPELTKLGPAQLDEMVERIKMVDK